MVLMVSRVFTPTPPRHAFSAYRRSNARNAAYIARLTPTTLVAAFGPSLAGYKSAFGPEVIVEQRID